MAEERGNRRRHPLLRQGQGRGDQARGAPGGGKHRSLQGAHDRPGRESRVHADRAPTDRRGQSRRRRGHRRHGPCSGRRQGVPGGVARSPVRAPRKGGGAAAASRVAAAPPASKNARRLELDLLLRRFRLEGAGVGGADQSHGLAFHVLGATPCSRTCPASPILEDALGEDLPFVVLDAVLGRTGAGTHAGAQADATDRRVFLAHAEHLEHH